MEVFTTDHRGICELFHYYIHFRFAGILLIMSPLESIATAYLLMEPGATAGWVANAKLLPGHKPELAVAYALVAEMYGFKLLFIDTSSGGELFPTEIIKMIAGLIHIPIIVGGSVVNESDARTLIEAGTCSVNGPSRGESNMGM